jgi:hypothetical protein
MTIPLERRRAFEWAGELLKNLTIERNDRELWGAPIPEALREQAKRILRHYPSEAEIIAATEMDDVVVSEWISKDDH